MPIIQEWEPELLVDGARIIQGNFLYYFSQLYAFFTLPLLAIFYRVRSVARGVFICLILQIKWPFESLMFLIAFHLPISFHGCPSDFTVVKCTFT